MNTIAAAPETMELASALLHAGAHVEARLEEALEAECGLSLAKLSVLLKLRAEDDGLPLGVLAERLRCVKSNVTQLVDRLEAEGLVRRVVGSRDRRRVWAVVTGEGRLRCERGEAARRRAEEALLTPLDSTERETLAELLRRLMEGARA